MNTAFEDFKPEFFDNTPLKTAYDAVAPDTTKWRKFLMQMIAFADVPVEMDALTFIPGSHKIETSLRNPIAMQLYKTQIRGS